MKYFIGVELGVKNINIGVVDKYGKLLRKDTLPTVKERPYEEIIKDIAELSMKILNRENIDLKNVKFIGVGIPGIPNNAKGIIVRNYTLNFINTPIRSELQKHINLPVYIENDANCAALAESVAGAAEDIDFSVTIKIGTGIGGGIIINNKVYTGFNFAGAELGHMVISFGGEQCTCGRKGCWESYASGTALIKQTKEAAQNNPNSAINKIIENDYSNINELTAFEAAKAGDETGQAVFNRYIEYLAEGLVNIINILMPEVLIIGGEISKLGEQLLKPLRKTVYERIYSKEITPPELKVAETGGASIVIGAAMLGLYKDL